MKICVIGNSFIGAIHTAYKSQIMRISAEVDFYGAAGTDFLNISVTDLRLTGVKFSNLKSSLPLHAYDYIYIIGTLPSPHDLLQSADYCMAEGYSSKLTLLYLQDLVLSSKAVSIATSLKNQGFNKVALLPSNANLMKISKRSSNESIQSAQHLIEQWTSGIARYLPAPRALFDDNYIPKREFYTGSLGLDGLPVANIALHDMLHMNESGGQEILKNILSDANQRILSEASTA